jgi:hypothetical protein
VWKKVKIIILNGTEIGGHEKRRSYNVIDFSKEAIERASPCSANRNMRDSSS